MPPEHELIAVMPSVAHRTQVEALGKVDACTDWGCGGIIYDGVTLRGFMHPWSSEERALAQCRIRESSGVFEVLGCTYWLQLFGSSCVQQRLQLEMDSNPGVIALNRAFSDTPAMLSCVSAARKLCAASHISARWRFIRGDVYNKVADHLSHGRWDDAVVSARLEFGLELIAEPASSLAVFICPPNAQGVAESVQRQVEITHPVTVVSVPGSASHEVPGEWVSGVVGL